MTPNTAHISNNLSAYLDGELSDVERAEVEAALAHDPALAAELGALREAQEILQTFGPVRAPAGFRARILEATDNEPMPGDFWRWLRRPFGVPIEGLAVGLAAAAVLLFIAWPREPVSTQEGPVASNDGESALIAPSKHEGSDRAQQQAQQSGAQEAQQPVAAKARPKKGPRPKSPDAPDAKPPAVSQEQGTADVVDQLPAKPVANSPFRYVIRTSDPEVLAGLQRTARRHSGRVTDGEQEIRGTELAPGTSTMYVSVPSGAMTEVGRALERLGAVRMSTGDGATFHPSDAVPIEVEVILE